MVTKFFKVDCWQRIVKQVELFTAFDGLVSLKVTPVNEGFILGVTTYEGSDLAESGGWNHPGPFVEEIKKEAVEFVGA